MKKATGILLFFSLLFSLSSYADDNWMLNNDSVKSSYRLDDVVVVGFKGDKNLKISPISSSQISLQTIKENNIQNIKEITGLVPNFFMPDYGSKMTSPVYIRGIGSRINSPSVGLYVDGIPYFDRSSFDFNLNGVDRIEVLRGPQGTIFGRNTMGGIINVYTRSPFREKETDVNALIGNYDNYKIDVLHGNTINQRFGYLISGNYIHNGGYFENKYSHKKADKVDAMSTRIRFGWEINHQLTAFFTTAYEYSDQDGYPYGIYNEDNNTVSEVNYNEPSFYRRQMSNNGLTLEYSNPYFNLESQTSFQYLDGKQGIDQDFTEADNYYVKFEHRQQMYSQEINIKSKSRSNYKWQFGAFGFYENYSQANDVEYRKLGKESFANVTNPTMGWAIYHQSEIKNLLVDNLSLIMGIRYDWEKTKMTNNTHTLTNGDIVIKDPLKGENTYNQITPKVALQYTISNGPMFYYSLSKGYKTGGFNTTAENDADRTFKPEYSWSNEIGTKFELLDKRIKTEISFFFIDWIDQQISQKRATEQGFNIRNAGKSQSKGIEITTQITPITDLNVYLSYGYTHAKFKDYVYDESKDLNYNNNFLSLVPRNTVSVSANYLINVKQKWLDKIRIDAQYIGIGSLYWSDNNKSKQPYYNTINSQISFIRKQLSIDFWAKNITNEKYITYYFESMGNKFAQQSKPFTIGTNINLKF